MTGPGEGGRQSPQLRAETVSGAEGFSLPPESQPAGRCSEALHSGSSSGSLGGRRKNQVLPSAYSSPVRASLHSTQQSTKGSPIIWSVPPCEAFNAGKGWLLAQIGRLHGQRFGSPWPPCYPLLGNPYLSGDLEFSWPSTLLPHKYEHTHCHAPPLSYLCL